MTFKIVIPARMSAQRLPDKPLIEIAGKPLIVHVWERARDAGADEVIVAADDARIVKAVERAGGFAALTSPDHASGTDRIAEIATRAGWPDDTIVVNLQGDEPLVPPSLVSRLAEALEEHSQAGIATMATPIHDVESVFRPSVVKTVLDHEGYALYFSRAPIPWVRDAFAGGPPETLPAGTRFLRHLGLYAYRAQTLRWLSTLERASIEAAESLEQLRALAAGVRIHVTVVDEAPPPGVDTPEDLERVRLELLRRA